MIFLGVAVVFLGTIERRVKRRRALAAIHELRSLVHIVDMHQLTKDPEIVLDEHTPTESSPERITDRFELARYLDYCSEMLSLSGKVAALYVQYLDDPVVLATVTEVETLATGISGKIWQKIVILDTVGRAVGRAKGEGRRTERRRGNRLAITVRLLHSSAAPVAGSGC